MRTTDPRHARHGGDDLWLKCTKAEHARNGTHFHRMTGVLHPVLWEHVPVDFEVHIDDLEWALDLWEDRLYLDWQLDQAEMEA